MTLSISQDMHICTCKCSCHRKGSISATACAMPLTEHACLITEAATWDMASLTAFHVGIFLQVLSCGVTRLNDSIPSLADFQQWFNALNTDWFLADLCLHFIRHTKGKWAAGTQTDSIPTLYMRPFYVVFLEVEDVNLRYIKHYICNEYVVE